MTDTLINHHDECPDCDVLIIENFQCVDQKRNISELLIIFYSGDRKYEQKEKNRVGTYSSLIGRKSRDWKFDRIGG